MVGASFRLIGTRREYVRPPGSASEFLPIFQAARGRDVAVRDRSQATSALTTAESNWLPLWRVSSAKASCCDTALRYGRSRIIAGAALGEPVVRRCGLQAG